MSENVDVSWEPTYNISISHLDGITVYHLAEALKAYKKSNTAVDDDIKHCFNQTIEVCERIVRLDDQD